MGNTSDKLVNNESLQSIAHHLGGTNIKRSMEALVSTTEPKFNEPPSPNLKGVSFYQKSYSPKKSSVIRNSAKISPFGCDRTGTVADHEASFDNSQRIESRLFKFDSFNINSKR